MKKIIIASLVFVPLTFLTSCTITETSYYPGYGTNYVYSSGYYGYSPYWGTNLYSGYGWGNRWGTRWNRVYWGGGLGTFGYGRRGWFGRRW